MADGDFITRREFEAYREVVRSEHDVLISEDKRQNERLAILESKMEGIKDLTISINTLATDMKHMLEEVQAQGKRLESLESKDGDMWRGLVKNALYGIIALVIGYIFGKLLI